MIAAFRKERDDLLLASRAPPRINFARRGFRLLPSCINAYGVSAIFLCVCTTSDRPILGRSDYADAGKSGLRLDGRDALKRLIDGPEQLAEGVRLGSNGL